MADIAIDGASPAVASAAANTVTTASFTRPAAGGLLVAMVMGTSDTAPSVTDSAGLTWNRRSQQINGTAYAEIWTAPVTGSGAMTVTVTGSGSSKKFGLKVDGVLNQHPSSPIGTTGGGTSTSNNISPTGYASTAPGSRGFAAFLDTAGLGTPTSTDTGFGWSVTQLGTISGIAVRKSANTATLGENVVFNADAPGTSNAAWTWAALEIKPSSVHAEVTTTTLAVATTMPAPAVSTGAGATPVTISVVTAMPVPSVTTGAGATPVTISVVTAMPVPSVTTDNATVVQLDTVAVTATVPVPVVNADWTVHPATIAATVALPIPAVRVDADVDLSTIAVSVAMPMPVVSVPPLPGDRITRPGQIEWNGFLLGSGTPYAWQELQGWRDSPPIISGNVDQPSGHGSYPGQPYGGERVINWSMLTKAQRSQIAQAVRDMQMVTGISQSEDEGYLVVWDFDDAEPYLVQAHLTNRAPGPVDKQARLGLMRGALQWTAADPRIYSKLRHSVTVPIDVETDVLNDGNEATPQIMRIPGPCVDPQIENTTLDRVIAFNVTIGAGQLLEIDAKHGTVAIGTTDLLSTLIEGSTSVKDFVLGPGGNRLLWMATSGGTGMDVLWRHANT